MCPLSFFPVFINRLIPGLKNFFIGTFSVPRDQWAASRDQYSSPTWRLSSSELNKWCIQKPVGHNSFTLRLQANASQTREALPDFQYWSLHTFTRTHHMSGEINEETNLHRLLEAHVLFWFVWDWVDTYEKAHSRCVSCVKILNKWFHKGCRELDGEEERRRRGGVDEALSEGEERRGLWLAVPCRTSIDTTAAFA